jgi:hypothetical protein
MPVRAGESGPFTLSTGRTAGRRDQEATATAPPAPIVLELPNLPEPALQSPETEVRRQLERRGSEATAVAASAGTGTYSPVIPDDGSVLQLSMNSHVLVSHDFFLVISSLF